MTGQEETQGERGQATVLCPELARVEIGQVFFKKVGLKAISVNEAHELLTFIGESPPSMVRPWRADGAGFDVGLGAATYGLRCLFSVPGRTVRRGPIHG